MNPTREVIITSDVQGEGFNAAVWDPQTGTQLKTYKNAGTLGYRTLTIVRDSYLLAADSAKSRLHLWPLNSQTPVSDLRLTTAGKVNCTACTPCGSYLITAISEKLYVWQLCSGKLLATLATHYQAINCLSFNGDGSIFASGGEDGLVFVWFLSRAICQGGSQASHSLSDHTLPVKDLCFGKTSRSARLYTVSLDRTAKIYETVNGQLLVTLVFDAPLTTVALDMLESDLFVGASNGTVRKFCLRVPPRGMEHHVNVAGNVDQSDVFRGHEAAVTTLAISVDCKTLMSGSSDGAVHLWDIPSRQIVRTIRHKGPITAAFFAKYTENLVLSKAKPRISIHSLQRIADESEADDIVKVINGSRDIEKFLQADAFIVNGDSQTVHTPMDVQQSENKIVELQCEIDRLKGVNEKLYQFAVKKIINDK